MNSAIHYVQSILLFRSILLKLPYVVRRDLRVAYLQKNPAIYSDEA